MMQRNLIKIKTKHYGVAVEKAIFERETGFIRAFRDPRDADKRAGDGIVSYGQRIVSSKGSVRFAGSSWLCRELEPFSGFQVGIVAGDYWLSYIDVFWPSYPDGEWILRILSDREQPHDE